MHKRGGGHEAPLHTGSVRPQRWLLNSGNWKCRCAMREPGRDEAALHAAPFAPGRRPLPCVP
jgi:hypothetical protein